MLLTQKAVDHANYATSLVVCLQRNANLFVEGNGAVSNEEENRNMVMNG